MFTHYFEAGGPVMYFVLGAFVVVLAAIFDRLLYGLGILFRRPGLAGDLPEVADLEDAQTLEQRLVAHTAASARSVAISSGVQPSSVSSSSMCSPRAGAPRRTSQPSWRKLKGSPSKWCSPTSAVGARR